MRKVVVAYIPVLHEGYKHLLAAHSDAEELFIFGSEIIAEFDYLAKEIRALDPEDVKRAIESWKIIPQVTLLNKENIESLKKADIVLPDEDVCHMFAEKYLQNHKLSYDPIFLRWDRINTVREKKVGPHKIISKNEFMNNAFKEAERSADWWRQVGAVIVRDGEIILSGCNKHVPSVHKPYAEGDPRNAFHRGVGIELSTVLHIEAGLIAEAAKVGIPLEGTEMYVTTFPCPVCAKQIAYSGIKKVYYSEGYAVLDGQRILKDVGIEIVQIEN